ncbi:hypothetical protein ABH970_006785 [Bradyrhizobium ottawaense]
MIGIKRPVGKNGYRLQLQGLHGMIEVSDFGSKDSTSPVRRRTGIDPISAGEDARKTDGSRRCLG